ncbi:MAG: L-serine ammonia-lyase, iron-sulfur-dependent subunit beta [Spirochaetes bacterium]|nr:L-serine ammonia-lyase, iron-sulfur-dependent subunit beta [Spirochaetota bacterium]
MADRPLTIFDMFGPVMIGPSSSHTAGIARIAFLARSIFDGEISAAKATFYGSLARTWKGHGSDKALVAGLLGIYPDDERLGFSLEIARRMNLNVEIISEYRMPGRYHPNTVVIELSGGGRTLRVRGASVGGGSVLLQSINGFDADLTGELDAVLVLHHDEIGVLAGVTAALAGHGVNIACAASHRREKGDEALLVVEVDDHVPSAAIAAVERIRGVISAVHVPARSC